MRLDQFVKETLLDITNGVAQAQDAAMLFIDPGYINSERLEERQLVRFEVGVTVSKEGGGGISVFSLGDVKAGASSEHTNKISFEVPVYLNAPTVRNPHHHTNQAGPIEIEEKPK
ncbi:MAG: hypothetical protein WBG95_06360 [Sulfitobacter sp.]